MLLVQLSKPVAVAVVEEVLAVLAETVVLAETAVMVPTTMLFITKLVKIIKITKEVKKTGAKIEVVTVDIKTPMLVQMLTMVGIGLFNVYKMLQVLVELEEPVVLLEEPVELVELAV